MSDLPIFASDELYSASGEPWDAQPTKVEPSGGILASGFVPGEPVSVELLNYLLNAYSTRMMRADLANVLNWPDKWSYSLPLPGNVVPDFARSTWDQRALYYVTNTTTICVSYDNGQSWATDDTLAGASYTQIAAYEGPTEGTSAMLAACTVAGAGRVSMRGQTAAWDDQGLTGCATPYAVVADRYTGKFLVVGDRTGGGAPGVWVVDANDGATGGTIATAHPTAGTYPLRTVAAGDPYKLAARTGGTGLWRWEDGDANATAVTPPGLGDVQAIVWNHEDQLFYLAKAQAGQPSIWTSATGATGSWTAKTLPGAGTMTGTIPVGGGFEIGPITGFIFQAPNSLTETFLLCTKDKGETWFWIHDPLIKATGVATTRVRRVGNGLLASDYGVSGNVPISLSWRGGQPL